LSRVHPPRLDRGAIIAPEQDVVLGDGGRMQHADHLGGRHLRPQLLGCLAVVEPVCRHEFDAVETDRQVVVGETEHDAVAAGDLPAGGKRGGAAFEMGGEAGIQRPHSCTSTSGMAGASAASKLVSSTSSRSLSKRTGTSNRNPAVTASPAAGEASSVTRPASPSTLNSAGPSSTLSTATRTEPATGLVIGRR